jgi:hypothetical protein
MRWSALVLLVGAMVGCGGGSYNPVSIAHGAQDPGPRETVDQTPTANTCQSACETALRCGMGPISSCLEFCDAGPEQQTCVICIAQATCNSSQCAGPCGTSGLQAQDPSLRGGT